MRKQIDPETGRDTRYQLIRVMYERGEIEYFRHIFKFIPKTTISLDLKMAVDSFNNYLVHLDVLPLKRYFDIAKLCGLTEKEIMGLVLSEREALKAGKLQSIYIRKRKSI